MYGNCASHPDFQSLDKKVLVISNISKNCPLWAHHPIPERNPFGGITMWFLWQGRTAGGGYTILILPLDFPSDLGTYFNQTFQLEKFA